MQLGIPLIPFAEIDSIDLTIDGADEVDGKFNLIKGGGGALLREKILASNCRKFIVIVDESKVVNRLCKFPLPVEIVPFAAELTIKRLGQLPCTPEVRMARGKPFLTDNGNWIVDCHFGEIADPGALSGQLKAIAGVVEHGLFLAMTDTVAVGHTDGTAKFL